MKLLYVGCRVRIIFSRDFPELNGTEGLIIARGDDPEYDGEHWLGEKGQWIVSPDLWGGPTKFVNEDLDDWFTPESDQLEPILPDGLLEEIMHEEVEPEMALIAP